MIGINNIAMNVRVQKIQDRSRQPITSRSIQPSPTIRTARPDTQVINDNVSIVIENNHTKTNLSKLVRAARDEFLPKLSKEIEMEKIIKLNRVDLEGSIREILNMMLLSNNTYNFNHQEMNDLVRIMIDEMLGLGPLEPLLANNQITDIMVNGPAQVYVEIDGKLRLSDVQFRDKQHIQDVAYRIVNRVGRRIDATNPMCDARLEDGSRINVIIPPLALSGPTISIRKFNQSTITLDRMVEQGNMSESMARILKIATRSRCNILISGGTGTGKTTLLNALSQFIDPSERIITIEDAAELQLQQPHVVSLETRPPNIEGNGEIKARDLLRNSLRMRPDRIIIGEVRNDEVIDMLQAMNTGHDGSLGTVHANTTRDALSRLENMVILAAPNIPSVGIRQQIVQAIDLVVQISRMRDGRRRIINITELVGMEGDVIVSQDLFKYEHIGEGRNGFLEGNYKSGKLLPVFTTKAQMYNLDETLREACFAD